ncbi:hypothetical protein N656DRAFT_771867 [Canariomyces notabilis]|uniref:CHAT domain-containing protein n=1 Tax=Canariomyces notabilis TaxID=2074819 RepID=A0AAN6QDJ2_9PEZI|nr:hypothetical protein N656DRAFT_771867 [Canariomyces arenarius]
MNLIVSRLGLLLRLRFLKFGRLADVDLAVQRMEEVLSDPRSSRDNRRETNDLELLGNYALILETRFDRTGALSDIEKCVQSNERVLSLLPPDDPSYPDVLCSLSGAYSKLFKISKDTTHLDAAMAYARKSLPILRMNPQAHVVALNDIGSILYSRLHTRLSQGKGPLDYDLLAGEVNEALDCVEEALRQLPERQFSRGTLFFNLARLLQSKNAIQPSDEIQARCLAVYQEAGMERRLPACGAETRWTEASAILQEMIQFMDMVAPRWLPSKDRLDILSEFHGIAADAAAARLMCSTSSCNTANSSVYEALRLLEMGRAVVLCSKLDYRSASRSLEAVSNGLAERFNRLTNELDALARFDTRSKVDEQRRKLNNKLRDIMTSSRGILDIPSLTPPLPSGSLESYNLRQKAPHVFNAYEMVQREISILPPEGHEDEISKRHKEASRDFDRLVAEIRQHDGLHDFLRPLSLEATIALAGDDHIVIVSSSAMVGQGNATIVNRDGISSIPLAELRPEDIERLMDILRKATTSWTLRTTAANDKKVTMVLKYLWVTVVNPVLVHLEKRGHLAGELLPRVHWIGTGLLSGAPFHAAGDYAFTQDSTGTGTCAMDYVVSSYTPTLRSLAYALESHQEQHGSLRPADRMLIVSAATVPGQKQLQSIAEEVMSIRAIASMASLQSHILDGATPASVLSRLPLANIVHFACHGEADPRDIENSHLVLHADITVDGEAPRANDSANEGKLTVREIQASKMSNATIAYLSTCSGAESKATKVSDEVIHIVSAFQIAGFEHVIGSLWKTKDAACRQVAEEFYRALWRAKGPGEPAVEVHHALHIAVQLLREKHRDKPLIWAPFVHYIMVAEGVI